MSDNNPTIVVCEDNEDILNVILVILRLEGFEVIPVRDSPHIFQAIADHAPALIILDLRMPLLDGEEITLRLKADAEKAHIPILLLSANPEGRSIGSQSGAEAFLPKPFEVEELLRVVKDLIKPVALP